MPGEYKFTALTRSLATTLEVWSWTGLVVDKLASDLLNVEITKTEVGAAACEEG
jgi:hypothetical protein